MDATWAVGAPDIAVMVDDFHSTVAEMAACRARVGVARRPDLAVDELAPGAAATGTVLRRGPGSWLVADDERTLVVCPGAKEALTSAETRRRVALSIVGPRMRRLLRACGSSVPAIGSACRARIGSSDAWVLVEEAQHALIVVGATDLLGCCEALEAQGTKLGCVFVGQAALHQLAAAHVLTLS